MRAIALIVCAGLFAACANEPARVAESNPTVTFRYAPDQLDEARAKAAANCSQYGKDVRLVNTIARPGGENIATFECI